MTSAKKPLIVLAAAAFTLAACGGGSSTQSVTATTAASNTTSSTVAESTTTVPVTSPPVSTPSSSEVSYLTNVRVAGQGSKDRVTFEFEGGVPGYSIGYVDTIATGEEGSALSLEGTQKVEIRFSSASMVKLTGGVTRTYTGESRIVPTDTSLVAEVAQASSAESVLTWGVGLRSPQPFTVSTLTNPSRVVIDFG